MITYLLDTLVNSIKTSLINKLGLDPSTEVDLDDFPELIDEIPILDSVEELTVTENGTYTGTGGVTYNPVNVNLPLGSKNVTANGTYTASDDSLEGYSSVTVAIDDTDAYKLVTDTTASSVKTLTTAPLPFNSLKVGIEAVQDLHGYTKPWAGGAGKNKLPLDLDTIKSLNTDGTWSGNSYTYRDVTFNVAANNGGNVAKITVNGTASAWCLFRLAVYTPSIGDYILSNSSSVPNGQYLTMDSSGFVGNGTSSVNISITESASHTVYIGVDSGTSVSNKVFKPMIRLSTETDATFEPYSNICPITGWDAVNLNESGKNLIPNIKSQASGITVMLGQTEGASVHSLFLKAGTYTLTVNGTVNGDIYIHSEKTLNGRIGVMPTCTFTLTEDDSISLRIYLSSGIDVDTISSFQLELGSTATTYEAYNGQTYTIDLDGTRYGGTPDVVNGVFVVDRGILTLNGSEDYYYIQASGADDNTVLRVVTGQACMQNENQKSNYGTFDNYAWQRLESRANTFVLGSEGNLYLQLPSSIASTVAEFKALFASNPLQVVYELVTPITIQLPSSLIRANDGTTNLWADSGDIEEAGYFEEFNA